MPPSEGAEEPPVEDDAQQFDLKYVKELRGEAAANRVRADKAASRLLETVLAMQAGQLADPADLLVYTDQAALIGEDGLVDPALVEKAVRDLLSKKPHLAKPVFTQDLGQGPRGKEDEGQRSFVDILRSAAG